MGKDMAERMDLRELVLSMHLQMEKEDSFGHTLLRSVLDKHDYLSAQEKGFVKRVTEGTIERRIQLDYIIDSFSNTPVRKMKPLIRCLIRMSVYQILYMDGVPDSAVCNEAVKLAQKHKFGALKGFVNGVLRNISRNKEHLPCPDREKDLTEYLSVCYSMPRLLVSLWLGDYGAKETEELLQAFMQIKPISIRVREDLEKQEKETLLDALRAAASSIKESAYLPYAYELEGVDGVAKLPGFDKGLFTVQDVSSMLCVEAADIRPGDFVLDVCAAPGGKATHAAIKLRGSGQVLARDLSEEKAALLEENKQRQCLEHMKTQVFDATVFDPQLEEQADIVFADLPCSGLGVIGKKRDIKYHYTQEQMESLCRLQKEILHNACRYVKPGGTLIYSTCTVNRKENEETADWILQQFPFERKPFSAGMPLTVREAAGETGQMQLLPNRHKTDGFFFALFVKRQGDGNGEK